ncbi:MAG: class E sortase [Thermoleophilia bacterium]
MIKSVSILAITGIILMVVGVGILLYVPATWVWGWYDQRGLSSSFEQESAAALTLNKDVMDRLKGQADTEKLRQLAILTKSRLTSEQTIARIEIPKIGVNAIVVEGTTEGSLRKGPGHLEETPLPGMGGNFGVAGDRVLYGGPFLNLDEVGEGDEVTLQTSYGVFKYVIVGTRLTVPEDVSDLQPQGYDSITLITCDPPWDTSHRLIVKGRLTSGTLLENQPAA